MRSTILLLFMACICVPACAPSDPSTKQSATVTKEQFLELHWIAGKWRGTGEAGAPFFESYRVVDDSTIAGTTWADSTFSNAADSSSIRLRNGEVASGPGDVATRWEGNWVQFEPRGQGGNSYTWRKENADRWTAQLHWVEKDGKPGERTYIMTRFEE